MRSLMLLSLFLFTLMGCVSGGNALVLDQTRLSQIIIDVSTKNDVKRLLGQPNSVSQQSGSPATVHGSTPLPGLTYPESWSYHHISVDVDGATFIPIVGLFAGGSTSHINTFTVSFDEAGIVRYLSSTQSEARSGMGSTTGPTMEPRKK
jgi:hypothetical protein